MSASFESRARICRWCGGPDTHGGMLLGYDSDGKHKCINPFIVQLESKPSCPPCREPSLCDHGEQCPKQPEPSGIAIGFALSSGVIAVLIVVLIGFIVLAQAGKVGQ